MDDWRLRSNFTEGKQDGGRIEFVRLFSIIALLLIFIACINFMNLATARSEQRMREVGVRKVMGAERFALMKQFIGESLVMSFMALIIACLFVLITLPFFNELVEKKLSLGLTNPLQWLLLIGIAIVLWIYCRKLSFRLSLLIQPGQHFQRNAERKIFRCGNGAKGIGSYTICRFNCSHHQHRNSF